jgi:flavin-dependent dehydrogenase
MVQRADFDLALVRSARKRGLVFHENEQFIAAERQRDTIEVKTSRGNYVVKALVGADGSLSTVRRLMVPSHHACLASTLQVSAPVDLQNDKGSAQERARIDLSPIDKGLQGYLWHFPCLNNGKPFANLGIGSSRLLSGRPKADLKKIFSRELHDQHIEIRPESWSSHPIRWFSHDVPISQPNVILAGDAAGIEPAFGGGIHMALSYGEIAAQELVQAFQTHDFSFRHYKEGLISHPLGQYIRDYTLLAKKIYSGKESPLEQVRQFYSDRFIRRKLQSLLLGKNTPGK